MTSPAVTAPAGAEPIAMNYGETAVFPVPEGRVVLRAGSPHSTIEMHPPSGVPYEVGRFVNGSISAGEMMTVALAALAAWK